MCASSMWDVQWGNVGVGVGVGVGVEKFRRQYARTHPTRKSARRAGYSLWGGMPLC